MKKYISLFIVAAVLTVCLFTAFGNAPVAEAQQITVPQTGSLLAFAQNTAVATSTTQYGPILNIAAWDDTEMQYVIDQGIVPTNANTITVSLDYSNDKVNWSTTALVTANAADASGWLSPGLTGAYGRLRMAGTNTNTVTLTFIALAKNNVDVTNNVSTPEANVNFTSTIPEVSVSFTPTIVISQ
jgi:hypothetical protein